MAELRIEYHRQLAEIDTMVMGMLGVIEQDIAAATTALLDGDRSAAETVASHAEVIESGYLEVETRVQSLLLHQTPVAGELRFLLTVFRILPELRYTHALADQIARRGRTGLLEETPPRVATLVGQQFSAASGMWRQVATAYLAGSADIVEDTEGVDDELDDLYASLTAELTAAALRPPVLMEMALVARFAERLGYHAVEVARQIEAFEPPWRTVTENGLTR